MMRSALPRAVLRPLGARPAASGLARQYMRAATRPTLQKAQPLALTAFRQNTALVRTYADALPGTTRDPSKEAKFAGKLLATDTEAVTASSSTTPVLQGRQREDDVDMMAGVRHDVKVIKETFALNEVPREAYNIGLAGVLPYLATSTATVVCAFEFNGGNFLMSEHTAELCLHVLEPLQVGYGAVIISFLGAIHWGLEWAGFGGRQGYSRYAIGVLAPAIAWPTVLMPVEYALITQFLAFNALYAVDSTAAVRGWVPSWYAQYRFILTFVVGASIVLSLIGRGQVQDRIGKLPSISERIKELRDDQAALAAAKDEAADESE